MAKTFAYRARDRNGLVLTGSLVAENEAVVAAFIREQGGFVTQIKEARQQALKALLDKLRPVGEKDLAVVCRQFATMIDAGLPLVACLNILLEHSQNPRLKGALRDISRKVQEGGTLSGAMQEHPQVFPGLMAGMMEAAEVGGVLDVVLNRLAVHFEKEYKMNEKVRAALTYPAVVLGFAVLVVAFILTFVMPVFVQQFVAMKVELPLPTRILLTISGLLSSYGLLIAAGMAAVVYGAMLGIRRPRGRSALDRLTLRLPVFGPLWRKVAIARFTRTLATLLRGGVPILTALEAVKRTTANTLMIESLTLAQTGVREGQGLSSHLGASGIFTPMVAQMIAVGEETGELDKMLDKVADFYESDVEDTVSRLSSLLEPALIVILAVTVGSIVVSIMLPIFQAITNVGR